MKTIMFLAFSVLSFLTNPVFSHDTLVPIHPKGCDNEMMTRLCNSKDVQNCYTCVHVDRDVEVCVPVYNHQLGTLERFPVREWNCSIHRHIQPVPPVTEEIEIEDKLEELIDVISDVLDEEDDINDIENILHNDNHFVPFSIRSFRTSVETRGCGGLKLKCILHKTCRNLVKEMKECNNDPVCMVRLIGNTDDEHFLRLVECLNGN